MIHNTYMLADFGYRPIPLFSGIYLHTGVRQRAELG